MMTHNKRVLARIATIGAVQKASRAYLPSPNAGVMMALEEAIQEKRGELEALLLSGKTDSAAYRTAKSKLAKWSAAWNANR